MTPDGTDPGWGPGRGRAAQDEQDEAPAPARTGRHGRHGAPGRDNGDALAAYGPPAASGPQPRLPSHDPYGPANPYGQTDRYGQPDQPDRYGQPDQPDRYGQPDPYGPPDPYEPPDPYSPPAGRGPADRYGAAGSFGAPDPYGPPDPYSPPATPGPPGAYGPSGAYGPADPLAGSGGRTPRPANAYESADAYGDDPLGLGDRYPGADQSRAAARRNGTGPNGTGPNGTGRNGSGNPQRAADPYGPADPSRSPEHPSFPGVYGSPESYGPSRSPDRGSRPDSTGPQQRTGPQAWSGRPDSTGPQQRTGPQSWPGSDQGYGPPERYQSGQHGRPDASGPLPAYPAVTPYSAVDPYGPPDPYGSLPEVDPFGQPAPGMSSRPMPATPYDDASSPGWADHRGDRDDYDSQASLPGLPAAAGDAPARGGPFRWRPPEVPGGPDAEPYTAEPHAAEPYSGAEPYQGGPDYPGPEHPAAQQYPVPPGYRGARPVLPGDEPSAGPGSAWSYGRDEPDGLAGGRDSDGPDPGGHPDWAGDDQHPGFFRGFGDDDGVDPPRRRHSRWAAPLIALVVILVVVGSVGVFVVRSYQASHANYTGAGTGQVIFVVKAGDNATVLAPRLVKLGVIKAPAPFIAAAKSSAAAGSLTPGTIGLRRHMSAALAWARLVDPKARIQTTIRIADGLRATAILASLVKQTGKPLSDFQKALADTAALGLPSFARGKPEGYLYPATYTFPPGTTPLKMLQTMVAQFNTEAATLNLAQRARQVGLSASEVIIQASIFEAEVGPSDYPKVARVIDNRLNSNMTLGLDSTLEYGLGVTGFNLTTSQLHSNSPYNTGIHHGLPPTPISNPGAAAIQAALQPAKGNWLYFVTVDPKTGQTDFTNSYQQFLTWSRQSAKAIKNGT